jgi:hypothetical protein
MVLGHRRRAVVRGHQHEDTRPLAAVRHRVDHATREQGTALATAALVSRLQVIAVIGVVVMSSPECGPSQTPSPPAPGSAVASAIPRPSRLRGREFRGCVDGEHVPACVDGRCALEALSC